MTFIFLSYNFFTSFNYNLVGKISAHFKNTPCISYFIKCTPRLTLRPLPERIGHDRAIHQKQRLRKAHRELEDRPRRRQEEHSPPGKQLPRRIRPLLTTRQQRHVYGTHQQNHGQICQTTPFPSRTRPRSCSISPRAIRSSRSDSTAPTTAPRLARTTSGTIWAS
jgi:hypothetical protein